MIKGNCQETHHYDIKICGHLGNRWVRMFEGLEVTLTPDGHTIISGDDIDQSALFGILLRIRDAGITLLCVNRASELP